MTSRVTPASGPSIRRRHPVALTVDIVASALLILFTAVLATVVTVLVSSYSGLCTSSQSSACNATSLSAIVFGVMAVVIVVAFLGVGMVIVSLIRRRLLFVWPLGAIGVILVAFYLGTWVATLAAPAP